MMEPELLTCIGPRPYSANVGPMECLVPEVPVGPTPTNLA